MNLSYFARINSTFGYTLVNPGIGKHGIGSLFAPLTNN
jgi:hypothetical protein